MNTLSTSKQKLSLAFKIIKDTVQGFIDDNVMRLSASLAYATLFSIIPLFSINYYWSFSSDWSNWSIIYSDRTGCRPKVIEALRSIIENAAEADVSSFATIISVGVTIFSATTVFAEIQSSLNTIWGIKAVPRKSWLKYIKTDYSLFCDPCICFHFINHIYHN